MEEVATIFKLYPDIESYTNGFLDLDGHHQMYWELSGNPKGLPVVFLHGAMANSAWWCHIAQALETGQIWAVFRCN